MVEKITAWRDRNGDLHKDQQSALLSDARIELNSMFRNEGIAKEILNNRARIHEVIDPLVTWEKVNIPTDEKERSV